MGKTFVLILSLILTASVAQAQKAVGCAPATPDDKTMWGHIATEIDGDPVARLSGRVQDMNGGSISQALVEVFADDGDRTPTSDTAKRLVGCITGLNGKYHFKGLRKGNYILAVGARGFNITFVKFKFDPSDQKARKNLDVALHVGT